MFLRFQRFSVRRLRDLFRLIKSCGCFLSPDSLILRRSRLAPFRRLSRRLVSARYSSAFTYERCRMATVPSPLGPLSLKSLDIGSFFQCLSIFSAFLFPYNFLLCRFLAAFFFLFPYLYSSLYSFQSVHEISSHTFRTIVANQHHGTHRRVPPSTRRSVDPALRPLR